MNKPQHPAIVISCLLVILAAGAIAHIQLWNRDTKGEDVYYVWMEGSRLLNGEDPYARILAGNMRENDKYATYFPGFYGLSALTQAAGLRDYEAWIAFWRVIFLAFDLAIGAALYLLIYPRGRLLAASFAAAFWLFSRWTLHVTEIAHLDFIPIFLMIASLGLFRKHRWSALLLFSLSLGVKQIAIFLVPLFLIWTWQSARQDKLKQTLLAGLVIASVPILILAAVSGLARRRVRQVAGILRHPQSGRSLLRDLRWTARWAGWACRPGCRCSSCCSRSMRSPGAARSGCTSLRSSP